MHDKFNGFAFLRLLRGRNWSLRLYTLVSCLSLTWPHFPFLQLFSARCCLVFSLALSFAVFRLLYRLSSRCLLLFRLSSRYLIDIRSSSRSMLILSSRLLVPSSSSNLALCSSSFFPLSSSSFNLVLSFLSSSRFLVSVQLLSTHTKCSFGWNHFKARSEAHTQWCAV